MIACSCNSLLCADCNGKAALFAKCAALEARIQELEGIRPELPPRPTEGGSSCGFNLPRYGLRWNGSTLPLAVPMADGYWTPWHMVQASLDEATHAALLLNTGSENARLRAELQAMRDYITEVRDVILQPLAMGEATLLSREAEGFGQASVALLNPPTK